MKVAVEDQSAERRSFGSANLISGRWSGRSIYKLKQTEGGRQHGGRRFVLRWLRRSGMEIVQDGPSSPGMEDLPESCIAFILSLTTPRDVARLGCVSCIFRDASYSDLVWQSRLPPLYEEILAQAPDAPPSTCSKKEIYDYMTTPVLLDNGTQDIWLDRATGGVCRSIGARGLSIIWGDDPRYWAYTTRDGSRFAEVAYLIAVCWLELRGQFQCSLPPGTYTLSWRLCGDFDGFNRKPVKFGFEGPDGTPVSIEVSLNNARIPDAGRLQAPGEPDNNWVELDVGEFTVERGHSSSLDRALDIKFSMQEIAGGFWKSRMFVDSVLIRPTAVRDRQADCPIRLLLSNLSSVASGRSCHGFSG